ncbi:MAG TPA: HNH endonuclease [Streptosporangiaceae bacterium]|nr:HNH endonuclease [Streptosporangiaceae bacterium]
MTTDEAPEYGSLTNSRFRRRVWERDGGRCGLCGEPVAYDEMHLDHVVPRIRGGTDSLANLRVTHGRCNNVRGNGDPRSPRAPQGSAAHAARLRAARKKLRMTQTALADELGVSLYTLNRWEKGAKPIGHPRILFLALLALVSPARHPEMDDALRGQKRHLPTPDTVRRPSGG